MKSKFFEKWSKLRNEGKDLYVINDNNILVEALPEEEVKLGNSGLIMAQDKNYRAEGAKGITAIVLDVGRGYYNSETKEYTPMDVKPGNIVLLPEWSVQFYRQFPGFTISTETRIGLTTEDNCKLVYKDIEAFESAKDLLND